MVTFQKTKPVNNGFTITIRKREYDAFDTGHSIGPHTGYDIKQHMEQSTQYFWKENYGQIYPGLAELLKNNLQH